jgi:integrase
MASVTRRSKSRFWYACYTSRDGRQVKKSTKTEDKASALRMAIEWERVERLSRDGLASTFQFQQVVSKVSREVMGEALPCPTVASYFAEWLEVTKRRVTERSALRYAHTADLFLKSLGTVAQQPLRALTPRHIERFMVARQDAGVAPKTLIVDVKTLSAALGRAQRFGYLDLNPVPAVRLPRDTSSEREVFTPEEVHKLVAAAPDLDWQTLILLGYYLGARQGDCVRLTWDHVNAERGVIVYEQRKTGKKVVVPIHFELLRHLDHVSTFHAQGPLCPKLAGKTSGGNHGLSEGFKRIVLRAGLDPMIVPGKGTNRFARRSFHSLRHSFNSLLANAGIAEEVRMRLTGHSSREIHAKYTHLNVDPLKKAITALPGVAAPTPAA